MLGFQIVVIVKHGQGALNGLVNQVVVLGVSHHGNEAERVDNKRDGDKEQAAKQKQPQGLFLWKMCEGVPDKEHRKTGSGVDSRPFGGNGKGHTDAA